MPGGDRTGPAGLGPMTGRAAGYCAGFGVPGYMNPIPGRGFWGRGRGRGGGRGWRNWFHATGLTGWQRAAMGMRAWGGSVPAPVPAAMTPAQELDVLKSQADNLEAALADVRQRIEQLQAEGSKKAD